MNSVDFIVILLMAVSILIATLRGFTREVLTIVAWVGAALAVLYGLPIIRPMMQSFFESPTMADLAGGAALGIITLVVLSIISSQLGKKVHKSGLGAVDRSLGAVFGAVRGVVLLALIYILLLKVFPDNPPDWLNDSKLQPMLAKAADGLRSLAPPEFAGISLKDTKKDGAEPPPPPDKPGETNTVDKASEKSLDKLMEKASEKQPEKPPEKPNEKPLESPPEKPVENLQGYKAQARGDLDKLIERTEAAGKH